MTERSGLWRYSVCGMLLLATMLNYMDRQTLAQLATTIQRDYDLDDGQYGALEMGFGLAFAVGALVFGLLADRVSVRWLYPGVLLGWSLAGIATAYAPAVGRVVASGAGYRGLAGEQPYFGFLLCRVALGFFEAGHWPCALITTQTIFARKDRSFGNSILQSGAALGAILTPILVVAFLPARDAADHLPPGAWRLPFVAIGVIGMAWALPWLALVRGPDLARRPDTATAAPSAVAPTAAVDRRSLVMMFATLVVVVITINLTWQFFRAWLPKFLQERRGYTLGEVAWFISAYYIAADVGCIGIGYLVKRLTGCGWPVHRARLLTFAVCTILTLLSTAVAYLPAGAVLVGILLLVAAGTLGLFPNYYSFTQELSRKHQGKITGFLGFIAWVASALMQQLVGNNIEATHSYAAAIVMAGIAPLFALAALLLLWPRAALPPQAAG